MKVNKSACKITVSIILRILDKAFIHGHINDQMYLVMVLQHLCDYSDSGMIVLDRNDPAD